MCGILEFWIGVLLLGVITIGVAMLAWIVIELWRGPS